MTELSIVNYSLFIVKSMFPVLEIRKDFPILKKQINNKPLIYFDNAATSQKPDVVIDALADYYSQYNANIHRGIHTLSVEATEKFEEARKKIAKFIGAQYPEEIIFVRNATEGINLVAKTWGNDNLKKGDEILLTVMEHHSNIVPWILLHGEYDAKTTVKASNSIKINYIPINNEGVLNLEYLDHHLNNRTKLLSIAHASNVLGTVNPIKQIIAKAHANGTTVLVDAAQSVPHMAINVADLDCDFLVFSGHKMLGPTGIGVLYVKKNILETMKPFLSGGEMVKDVHLDHVLLNDIPWRFEAGTPPIAEAIAMSSAIDYLNNIGTDKIKEYETQLTKYALDKLQAIENIKIYGPLDTNNRLGVIAFNLADIHAHDLASVLDEEGIAIRSGHHCAAPLVRSLNKTSIARISFSFYNTIEEIDCFIEAIKKAKRIFKV